MLDGVMLVVVGPLLNNKFRASGELSWGAIFVKKVYILHSLTVLLLSGWSRAPFVCFVGELIACIT